jgi:hypothetical protein
MLGIDGFPLSLRLVHGPEHAGEMFGVTMGISQTGSPAALAFSISTWKALFLIAAPT